MFNPINKNKMTKVKDLVPDEVAKATSETVLTSSLSVVSLANSLSARMGKDVSITKLMNKKFEVPKRLQIEGLRDYVSHVKQGGLHSVPDMLDMIEGSNEASNDTDIQAFEDKLRKFATADMTEEVIKARCEEYSKFLDKNLSVAIKNAQTMLEKLV